jgi:hypothetical protein
MEFWGVHLDESLMVPSCFCPSGTPESPRSIIDWLSMRAAYTPVREYEGAVAYTMVRPNAAAF